MLPKGFYIFTELAAKDAIENKIKVGAFGEKLVIAESALETATGDLLVRTIERNIYKRQLEAKDDELKSANRKLAFSKVLNYVGGVGITILLILKAAPP